MKYRVDLRSLYMCDYSDHICGEQDFRGFEVKSEITQQYVEANKQRKTWNFGRTHGRTDGRLNKQTNVRAANKRDMIVHICNDSSVEKGTLVDFTFRSKSHTCPKRMLIKVFFGNSG